MACWLLPLAVPTGCCSVQCTPYLHAVDPAKSLSEQLAQFEKWCARRSESEYAAVAAEGFPVRPEHHAELLSVFPGEMPQADGWLLRSAVLGAGGWTLLGLTIAAGWMLIFASVFRSVHETQHPFIYALLLWIVPAALVAFLPLRMLLRSYQLVFDGGALLIQRRIFSRVDRVWKLHVAGEVRVTLAYRGARARRHAGTGVTCPAFSIVVSANSEEIVFGEDLDYTERARLALLIDRHYYHAPRF